MSATVQALQGASVYATSSNETTNPLFMVFLAMLLNSNNQSRSVNSDLDDVKQLYALFEGKQAEMAQLIDQLNNLKNILLEIPDNLTQNKQKIERQIQIKNNQINIVRSEMTGLLGKITTSGQGNIAATMYEANTSMLEASQLLQGLNKVNSKINQK
ncbi:MAG: hypothetical protein HZB76_06185 [Chlamydiae bacterium]|nr:hypothetical protein [Chlamydiota bacterium]